MRNCARWDRCSGTRAHTCLRSGATSSSGRCSAITEVEQANRDWETFSAHDGTTIVPFPRQRRGVMFVTKDPPEYTTIRRLISAGFTPRMIGRLEEQIRRRTERILDDAAATG